jgi:hypothetical protein
VATEKAETGAPPSGRPAVSETLADLDPVDEASRDLFLAAEGHIPANSRGGGEPKEILAKDWHLPGISFLRTTREKTPVIYAPGGTVPRGL